MTTPNLTHPLISGAGNGAANGANTLAGLLNGNANAARNGANLGADGVSFSQTLSREMAQRQAGTQPGAPSPAPAPQHAPRATQQSKPAEKAPDAKPAPADSQADASQQADSTASADAAPADQAADAGQAGAKPADDSATASQAADESSADQQVADANAAVTPVTDMLALMASLAKPAAAAAPTAAPAAAAGADAVGGIGKGGKGSAVRTDPAAIQALQDAADDASATSFATALTRTVGALGEGKGKAGAADGKALALPQDGAGKDLTLDTGAAGAASGKAADLAAGSAAAKPSAAAAAARADAPGSAAAAAPTAPQAEYATERLHIQTPAEQAALHDVQPTLAPAAAQVQAANSLEASQAATAGDRLSARVGTNAWEQQVGQKIVWMAAGGDQSAELTLNPPDLGPMQVVLSVNNDQASVAFSSAQPEVRAALESALPRLKEMMSESGLSLGNATVDAGNPGQQDQQQRMAGNAAGQGNRYGNDNGHGSPAPVNEVPAQRTIQRLDRGLVDLFA